MQDHYPQSANYPKMPEEPPVHEVEVDPDKPVLGLDEDSLRQLADVAYEDIEAVAADLGVTVNSGIIPVDVDGERVYIDTSLDDFGTRIRHVIEVEPQARSEETVREMGDTALTGMTMDEITTTDESDKPDVEADQTIEVDAVAVDKFVQEANTVISGFMEQSQASQRALGERMEALQADRQRMRSMLEEINQYSRMLMRMDESGGVPAITQRLNVMQDIASQARTFLMQQTENREDITRLGHEIGHQSEQATADLNARGYEFGAVVTEQMTKTQNEGNTLDTDTNTAQVALGRVQGVTVALRQLQISAEEMTMNVRRLNNVNENMLHGISRIATMSGDIVAQARHRGIDSSELEGLFRMSQLTIGQYEEESMSGLALLQNSLDEVDHARGMITAI